MDQSDDSHFKRNSAFKNTDNKGHMIILNKSQS